MKELALSDRVDVFHAPRDNVLPPSSQVKKMTRARDCFKAKPQRMENERITPTSP